MGTQNAAILTAGMRLLTENLGALNSEIFIMLIKQSTFDYTEWQSEHLYNGMTFEEISDHAVKVIEKRFDELPESIKRDVRGTAE
jgi:ATP phosphoribosyltransferase regulatory subunit HisZ